MVANINMTFLSLTFLMMTMQDCQFLYCTTCAFRSQGQVLFLLVILYFLHSTIQFPLLLRQGTSTEFFLYITYVCRKINPDLEYPLHPQEESGATWLIDMTSPEIEKAIWMKGKDEWKLLSQHEGTMSYEINSLRSAIRVRLHPKCNSAC